MLPFKACPSGFQHNKRSLVHQSTRSFSHPSTKPSVYQLIREANQSKQLGEREEIENHLDEMAQVVDLTSLLQAAQSADANARQAAEQGIKQFESQPESYLLSLSSHLANESNAVDTRRLAGK